MTTYIKLMSDEDIEDVNPFKKYEMLILSEGDRFRFSRESVFNGGASCICDVIKIKRREDEEYSECIPLCGNVYVMNSAGKTVSSYTPRSNDRSGD